jgi:hypothetical protein
VRHRTTVCVAHDNISTFDIELTIVLNGSILRVPVDTRTGQAEAMRARRKARTIDENWAAKVTR